MGQCWNPEEQIMVTGTYNLYTGTVYRVPVLYSRWIAVKILRLQKKMRFQYFECFSLETGFCEFFFDQNHLIGLKFFLSQNMTLWVSKIRNFM